MVKIKCKKCGSINIKPLYNKEGKPLIYGICNLCCDPLDIGDIWQQIENREREKFNNLRGR